MVNCVFCKIVAGQAPAHVVYKDDEVTAFRDIHPRAPTHILIVPNRHIVSVGDLGEQDAPLAGRLLVVAAKLARELGISDTGFRIVANHGADAGQSVFHLHLHLMGGRRFGWPPG
jgi:histidine triad (HIT) family protein